MTEYAIQHESSIDCRWIDILLIFGGLGAATTPTEVDCIYCNGLGRTDCIFCDDGISECPHCDSGYLDCLFYNDSVTDCSYCESGFEDCIMCEDGKIEC